MPLNNTHRSIAIFIFILLIGFLGGLKEATGAHPESKDISRSIPDPEISKLMASMNIQQLQQPITAPDFKLTSIGGEQVSLNNYRGNVIILSFWATW